MPAIRRADLRARPLASNAAQDHCPAVTEATDMTLDELRLALAPLIPANAMFDGWSDRAKECLATMESEADADGCASMLTAEQRQKIISDERIKLGTGKPKVSGDAPAPKPDNGKLMAGVFSDLERFRDRMCACKDTACAEKLNGEFMKWAQELEKKFGPDFKPDDKDQERLGKLVVMVARSPARVRFIRLDAFASDATVVASDDDYFELAA
jgi:hypothetical protein